MILQTDIIKNNEGNHFIDGDFFESLANENVKYIKIDELEAFLNVTDLSKITFKILITHNGDKPITKDLVDRVFAQNSKVIHWYGQNVNCYHEKLTCIPIGLERKRWFPELRKQGTLRSMQLSEEHINNHPKKLCYANFSIDTNNIKRLNCYNNLHRINCTNKVKSVVDQHQPFNYMEYLSDIHNHNFVICPEGNGIDTHRMWEAMYMARIPIVIRNHVTESFSDMPILFLDKWEDLSNELLLDCLDYIYSKENNTLNLEKLNREYWKNRIYGTKE